MSILLTAIPLLSVAVRIILAHVFLATCFILTCSLRATSHPASTVIRPTSTSYYLHVCCHLATNEQTLRRLCVRDYFSRHTLYAFDLLKKNNMLTAVRCNSPIRRFTVKINRTLPRQNIKMGV